MITRRRLLAASIVVPGLLFAAQPRAVGMDTTEQEAARALVSLGYDAGRVRDYVAAARALGSGATAAQLVKHALHSRR